ncbi:MAG TPA: hypothetical protein VMX15_04475 [Candidatus Heimdallarchaeota archaeon]|nr:hypothetical protein [Candidatus Heimdallarchaeota archaeon]
MASHSRTGWSNALPGETLFDWGMSDPTKWNTYFNDCHVYTAGDWVETAVSAGIGTSATTQSPEANGVWLMTGAANENDGAWYQLGGTPGVSESWLWDATKKMFFKARFALSDATQSDAVFGLHITNTAPAGAITDGIFFKTADASASLTFEVEKDSTPTSTTVATLANATFIEVGFYYNPNDGLFHIYADGVKVAESASTNAPDDEELALSWGSIAGAAGVDTSSWDYFLISQER